MVIFKIFNELYNSMYYSQTVDFLIAISEPIHRTGNFHEYQLTNYSLYAAASMNIRTEDILIILKRMCKHKIPEELEIYIKKSTETHGKVKLILKNQKYYIEGKDWNVKSFLLKNNKIYQSNQSILNKNKEIVIDSKVNVTTTIKKATNDNINISVFSAINLIANKQIEDENEYNDNIFEIDPESIEESRYRALPFEVLVHCRCTTYDSI